MVRNNIDAIQTTTHMDDSEFEVLNLKKKDFHMKLVNQMTKRCPLMLDQLLKTITLLLATSTVIHRAGDMTT